jgi:hypothetical protein
MNSTTESNTQGPVELAGPWLVLIAQLPAKPDYLRVKLRRRIQRIGALSLRGAVYVLPNREDTREDFMWLRGELIGDDGDAIVCSARALVGISDAELEARFRELRDADYREIVATAEALASAGVSEEMGRELARLRRRVDEVSKVDFFTSPGQAEALRALDQLAAVAAGATQSAARAEQGAYNGRTWVTRAGVFVDRMASAWLIRRFIDRRATFRFTSDASYVSKAAELRFDMFDGEFTHEGDRCTFETLLARFELDDPALHALAEIVHDIDCKDEKFARSEAAGVELVLRGLVSDEPDDSRRLERGSTIFDALLAQLGGAGDR